MAGFETGPGGHNLIDPDYAMRAVRATKGPDPG
jgi:hypothetical protein